MGDANTGVVSVRDLLQQVWRDWTDKEVQAGYTYTYIWMANQLGHFTLGFLPVCFSAWLVGWFCGEAAYARSLPCIAAVWAVVWAIKEMRDVVRAKWEAAGHVFPLEIRDLALDAGTAVFFFWAGIAVAALGLCDPGHGLASFAAALVLAVALPARYWLPRKLCFQRAHLPYLARLADFTSKFGTQVPRLGPQDILLFLDAAKVNSKAELRHLLVFGAVGTGRTYLAVAIGTEHSFQIRRVRYLTWTKFLELAVLDKTPEEQDNNRVWSWTTVDILILDDMVDKAKTSADSLVDEKQTELDGLDASVRATLKKTRVIWVFGNAGRQEPEHPPEPEQWIELLAAKLEMEPGQFGYVELQGHYKRPKVALAALSGN